MDSVAKIYVRNSAALEHYGVSRRFAAMSVARRVVREVTLGFGDSLPQDFAVRQAAAEKFAEQFGREKFGGIFVKFLF